MALNIKIIRGLTSSQRCFHRWVAPTLRCLKNKKEKMGPEDPQRRSEFVEWNFDAELYAFSKRLGEEFNKDLLKQALTDYSFVVNEENKQRSVGIEPELEILDNRSLIESGEMLMECYITQYLATTLPKLPKEYIGAIKDMLMSEETLSHVSKHIGTDDLVLCAEIPPKTLTLANALKSITQALALSSGEERAGRLVRDIVVTQLAGRDLTQLCSPQDPLATLDRLLSQEGRQSPEPRLIGEAGHGTILAAYQVAVYSDKKMIGKGFGETVEVAKDMAASDALWRMWGVTSQKRPFPFALELPPVSPRSQATLQ